VPIVQAVLSFFGVLAIALGVVLFLGAPGPVMACPHQGYGFPNACDPFYIAWISAAVISVVVGVSLILIDRYRGRKRSTSAAHERVDME
jgi:hypothetical protein